MERRSEMIWLWKCGRVLGLLIALFCAPASTWANTEDNSLFTAVSEGDLSRVDALLAAKVDVNAKKRDDRCLPLGPI